MEHKSFVILFFIISIYSTYNLNLFYKLDSGLAEIMAKMCQYRIEPKRIQFVHPYIDKEPTMVLIEGLRGGKSRVTVEPPIIMYEH